jgi:AraC-like DNA-binding protein
MRSALLEIVETRLAQDGQGQGSFPLPMPGVHLLRTFDRVEANHALYRPSLCVVLQGAKQFQFGDQVLDYGPMQALVVSMDLPATGRIVAAGPDQPFIGITIDFDAAMLREVLLQLRQPPMESGSPSAAFVQDIEAPLADCLRRLVQLAETPEAIPVLYPAIQREFYFWLLSGPHGGQICRQVLAETHLARVGRAVSLLRERFVEPLTVEQLASTASMSRSTFHHHFKALTGMSPLQFQKQMRLLEARRLMHSSRINVTDAAYQVGYESASQFSREYSRAFGVAPKRDSRTLETQPRLPARAMASGAGPEDRASLP